MSTGDSADILGRVKAIIPRRWFSFSASIRDAVLGGLSDGGAWCYSWITFARLQSRLATATGPFLDIVARDFLGRYLQRNGSSDDIFRKQIKATILQERVTRAGMVSAITTLTGKAPTIFEPWNTGDTGAYGNGHFAYGQAGGWGNMNLPGQAFMVVTRTTPSGVPNVAGYGSSIAGYGVGSIEYVGSEVEEIGVTDDIIYATIVATKPTGVIPWTRIQ